jgi:tetratricopeptide (TPR) repeat protein
MQRCGQCGHSNPDDSIFCGQCSHRLNNRCIRCGYGNLATQKFCGNCGRQLREDTELPPASASAGQRPMESWQAPPPFAMENRAALYPIEGTPSATEASLPEYALLSLEFANWEQTLTHVPDAAALEQIRDHYILDFVRAIQQSRGQVGHSKNGVLFASFPFANNLHESIHQALMLCLPWLETEFRFGNTLLRLKGGLDIELAHERNPLTSSLERSLAQAGSVILNEAAYGPIQNEAAAEPLGPVSSGGRTSHLFRLPLKVASSVPEPYEEYYFSEEPFDRPEVKANPAPQPVEPLITPPLEQEKTVIPPVAASHVDDSESEEVWDFSREPFESTDLALDEEFSDFVVSPPLQQPESLFPEEASSKSGVLFPPTPSIQSSGSGFVHGESLLNNGPSVAPYTDKEASQQDLQALWDAEDDPAAATEFFAQSITSVPSEFPSTPPPASTASEPSVVLEPSSSFEAFIAPDRPLDPEQPQWLPDTTLLSSVVSNGSSHQPPSSAPSSYSSAAMDDFAERFIPPNPVELIDEPFASELPEMPAVVPFSERAIDSNPVASVTSPAITPSSPPSLSISPSSGLTGPETDLALADLFPSGAPPQLSIDVLPAKQKEPELPPLSLSRSGESPLLHGASYGTGTFESDASALGKGLSSPFPSSSALPVTDTIIPASTRGAQSLPVQYEPPVLGRFQAARAPNVRYGQAIDSLCFEFDAFFKNAFDETLSTRRRVLTLMASDGLGKSNILGLSRSGVDPEGQRAIWLGGGSSRSFGWQGKGINDGLPLFTWLDIVYNLLGLLPEGLPRAVVEERVEHFLEQAFEGQATDEDRAVLSALLALDRIQPLSMETRAYRHRLLHFFVRLLSQLAVRRPVVLILEDVMFADVASLEFLHELLAVFPAKQAVCFVLTHTREFYPQGLLQEILQASGAKEIIASDLDDGEIAQFLDNGPLGGSFHEFPPALVNALYRQSGGLPLWLEEALRVLHLRGIIMVDPETGQFRIQSEFRPGDALLPDSLDALLQERLMSLDDTHLYVLRLAAVLGEKFPLGLLAALAQMEADEFQQVLEALANQGFILQEGEQLCRFRHGRLRDAVYYAIDADLRVQIHQLVSETLEEDFNQGNPVNPLFIAYHAECGQLLNRAMNYWHLAGASIGWLGVLTAMNLSLLRAMALLLETSGDAFPQQELALRTLEILGVLNLDNDPQLALDLLHWVVRYREPQGDAMRLTELFGFLATAYERKGNFVEMRETLEKALVWVDPQRYPLERASMQISRMEAMASLGLFQQARHLMETEIEPIAHHPDLPREHPAIFEACLHARLLKARILLIQCDPQARAVLEAIGNDAQKSDPGQHKRESLLLALQLLQTKMLLHEGRYEQCIRESDRLLRVIESLANSGWFLAQWGLLAIQSHVEMEDWDSVSQLVLMVIAKAEAVNDFHTRSLAEMYAGYATSKRGYVQEGCRLLEQALLRSAEHRFADVALLGWRLLAEIELSLGHLDLAAELLERALDVARKPDIQNTEAIIRLTFLQARTLIRQDRVQEAGRVLEPLWPQLAKSGWQPLLAACAFEISQLYLSLADKQTTPVRREKHLQRGLEFLGKSRTLWQALNHGTQVRRIDAILMEKRQSTANPASQPSA